MHRKSQQCYRAWHPTRVLGTTAASLLLVILAVRFWPTSLVPDPLHLTYTSPSPEVIVMEDILPTQQRRKPPPPPAPLPPVIMPEDHILEEPLDLDADFLPLDQIVPPASSTPATNTAPSAHIADTGPKPILIAEPALPRRARRRGIRAEIVVRVDIDRRGRVAGHEIVSRYLLGDDGEPREPVAILGYGLEEAAISAAQRWRFRPARKQGESVASQAMVTMKFGV